MIEQYDENGNLQMIGSQPVAGWSKAKGGESAVHSPKHYAVFDGGEFDDLDLEAIECIARTMTVTEFGGYCKGNILKYRLRAGKKDKLEQDIDKVNKYQEIFTKFVVMCYDYQEQRRFDSLTEMLD